MQHYDVKKKEEQYRETISGSFRKENALTDQYSFCREYLRRSFAILNKQLSLPGQYRQVHEIKPLDHLVFQFARRSFQQ